MRHLARLFISSLPLLGVLTVQSVSADTWSEQTHKAHVGDFNGDGFSDLFLQPKASGQPVQIVLGLGDGSYTSAIQEWGSSDLGANWLESGSSVAVGDFDGDGQDELLVQPVSGGNVQIYEPELDGTITGAKYSWPTSYAGADWSGGASRLLVGDFNGDGRDDVLIQTKTQSGLNAVVLTDTSGKPAATANQTWSNGYLGYTWSTPYRNLIIGDFNGDGRDDLLLQEKIVVIVVPLGSNGAPTTMVFRDGVGHGISTATTDGKFQGIFPAWQDGDYGIEWNDTAGLLLAADVDGDGISELLLQANGSGGTHRVIKPQLGSLNIITGFSTIQAWQDGQLGATWSSGSSNLLIGDVNGDGRNDVLIQAKGTGTTSHTALGNSDGTLAAATSAKWSEPPLSATNYAVGMLDGNFSVGPGGGASYAIPITVPPGIGGMQPDISLVYNSQSGNGIAGVGWSIGGLSSIHRCGKNLEQDGAPGGIGMTIGDKLCLDGSRPVNVSGAYGAAGTEYRTEIDSYSKIVQNDAGCGLACSFTVYTKAGQIFQYGVNGGSTGNGSRQELDGQTTGPLSWAVNRISDTVGNAINFNYTQSQADGSQHIDTITYTEHNGLTAQGQVEFSYGSRNDTSSGYLLGSKLATTQRLNKITTRFAGVAIKSYGITYKYAATSGLSLIDQVQECAMPESGNPSCFVPTRFTWTENPARFTSWSAWASNSSTFDLSRCRGIVQADANGDGLTDIICAYDTDKSNASARYTYVQLSTGNGYTNWQLWYSDGKSNTWLDLSNCSSIQPADFNADGLTDLVCFLGNNTATYVQLAQPNNSYSSWQQWNTGSANDCSAPEIGDVNGDGRSDIICPSSRSDSKTDMKVLVSTGTSLGAWQTWASSSTVVKSQCRDFHSGDANGDGLTDMICAYDTSASRNSGPARAYVWLSTGAAFSEQRWDSGGNSEELQNCSKQIAADVNGDGLTDLVCPYTWSSTSKWYMKVQLSTGNGYQPWTSWTDFPKSSFNINNCNRLIPADVDGDGKQDLVCPYRNSASSTTNYVMRSLNGSAFGAWESWGVAGAIDLNSCWAMLGGDVDGNGKFDMICVRHTGNYNEQTYVSAVTGTSADLLTMIEDGAGGETHVSYKPLTDPGVYTRDPLASCPGYPSVCLQTPLYVAAGISSSNGIGGLATTDYHYKYGRANVRGRGWLGFGEVSSTDITTGISTRTVYNQEFSADTGVGNNSRKAKYAKSGVPDYAETRLVNNTLIGKTVNTWNVVPRNGYTRFELQANTTTEYGYELDGSLVTTVGTQNSLYDAYGNVGRVSVTTTAGGQTFTKVTDSTYTNDTANWFLGRLLNSNVKSTTPTASLTRTSAFEYDPVTGLLTAEIIEPGDPNLELRTEYSYVNSDGQNYGLKTAVTVRDSGSALYPISASTSTTSYDFSSLSTGRYSVTSTNAKGHSETKQINALLGVNESLTGPNGLTTSWIYDDFGRAQTEYRADGTSTSTTHAWCDSNCPPLAVRSVTSDTTAAASVITYLDIKGREIRSETTGLNGRTILADTQYDDRGQVKSTSRNYFAGDVSYWTDTQYDVLGRVTKVTSPDGVEVSTTYNGLTTTITKHDLNGEYADQTISQVKDAIGQEVQIIDEKSQTLTKTYDPFGNLEQTIAPTTGTGANTTVLGYDLRGRKTSMDDPDMGHWVYAYDALGQLRRQTDNKGQVSTLTYDVLGRMATRAEAEGTTAWTYDSVTKGIGKLGSVSGPNGYQQNLSYDVYGRPLADVRRLYGTWMTASTAYDAYGRVERRHYPTGFEVQYSYNSQGYLIKAFNATNANDVFWQAADSDADGNATIFDLAGGTMRTVRLYEPFSGRLASVSTNTGIQFLEYHFDSLGNLRQRVSKSDPQNMLTEDFSYDERNRLTSSSITGYGTKSYAYDTLGNIKQKGTVTDYQYGVGSAGPHAVTTANGKNYAYDANGNMVSGAGRTINWTSYNKPRLITKGTTTVAFDYGPDRARYKQAKTVGGVTTTTLYFGKLYEQITKAGGSVEKKHYISVGGSTIAIYNQFSSGAENIRYLHTDHLGSTDVITDELGQVIERQSFDAFGARRNVNWSDPTGLLTSLETTRGFTGHEQLDEVGLVHMNGRVYDPALGRFISADPQVQFAGNLQSYNRYSYVHNNPLSFTDPSGFGLFSKLKKKFKKFWKKSFDFAYKWSGTKAIHNFIKKNQFAQMALQIAAASTGQVWLVALTSAALTKLNGGSWGDALRAGAIAGGTALAFFGLHDLQPGGWAADFGGSLAKTVAHGFVGGISSVAGGGSFQDGFLAAGFTQAASLGGVFGKVQSVNNISVRIRNAFAAAVVGGTASALGGGKFTNGAVTGAFSRMFNDLKRSRGQIAQKSRETQRQRSEARANGDIEGGLATFEDSDAGVLNVDGIKKVGPGGNSIPGGKGVGFVFTLVLRAFERSVNPHDILQQTQSQLSDFYYFQRDRVEGICYRCHDSAVSNLP